jgi:hypothetical protein
MNDDLIAQLKAASEGSQEVDAEIAVTQGWIVEGRCTGDGISEPVDEYEQWIEPSTNDLYLEPPPYTTSFDTALGVAGDQWLMVLQKAILGLKAYMASPPTQQPTRALRSEALRKRLILDVCIAALQAHAAGSTVIEGGAAG